MGTAARGPQIEASECTVGRRMKEKKKRGRDRGRAI